MVLSFAMVMGSIYISRKSEAAEGGSRLTLVEETELSASTTFMDDSENPVTLADLDELVIESDGKLTITADSSVAGNNNLTVSMVDGAELVINSADFVCGEIQSAGDISTVSGGSVEAGKIELSGTGTLINSGKVATGALVLGEDTLFRNNSGTFTISEFDTSLFDGEFINDGRVIADKVKLGLIQNGSNSVYEVKDSIDITGYNSANIGIVEAKTHTLISSTGGGFYLKIGEREESVSPENGDIYEAYELFGPVSLENFDRVDDENYLAVYGITNDKYAQEQILLAPKDGYLVKPAIGDAEYATSITFTKEDLFPEDNGGNFYEGLYFYIMDDETGEYATGEYYQMVTTPALNEIIFDNVPPTVTVTAKADGETVAFADGDKIKAKKLVVSLSVSDENMGDVIDCDESEVTLTGDGGIKTAEIEFNANKEEEEEHYISISDLSGNEVRYEFPLIYAKDVPTASISVEDIFVGGTVNPVLDTESEGSATIEYKLKADSEASYDAAVPTKAGEYSVRATIAETDDFAGTICESTFFIKRFTPTAEVSVPNVYVGTEYEADVDTDSDGEQTVEFKEKDADDSAYDITKPTEVGEYAVRLTIAESDNFEGKVVTSSFKILEKLVADVTVNISNVKIGEEYTPTVTCESGGEVKYEYKVKGTADSTYTETPPTEAGTYIVRATVKETAVYAELTGTAEFTISKLIISGTVEIDDCYVGDEYDPLITTASPGERTIEYKVQGAEDSTYTEDKPVAAGDYTVRVTIAETITYEEIICMDDFTISRYTPTAKVSVPNVYVGTEYEAEVDTDSNGDQTVEFKEKDADDSTYDITKPTEAGEYAVRLTIAESNKYEGIVVTSTFKISEKLVADVIVTISNVKVGEIYEPTATCESGGEVKFEYKVKGEDDNTYTETPPTAAGTYIVRATVKETAVYAELTGTAEFTISKLIISGNVVIDDCYVGDEYDPVVTTVSTGERTIEYKVKGAEDLTYVSDKPTAAGDYTVRATIAATDTYEEIICEDDFTISKLTTTAEVVIDDCYVGDEYGPVVSTDSTGERTFEYKVKGAEDSTYVSDKPTAAGDYTVRATIAETDTYNRIVCFDDFTISKITPTVEVSVPNTRVGSTYSVNVDTDSDGDQTIEFMEDVEGASFSETKPTAAGNYIVRVTIAESETFEGIVVTSTFKISEKLVADVIVTISNVKVGEIYEPTATCESGGEITFDYKVKGTADTTYTGTQPTEAGTYIVRATVEETADYAELTGTAEFTISKLTTTAEVVIDDCYVGDEYSPVVTTDSTGEKTYKYKVKGADDSTYDVEPPTAAGDYTVRATIAETDIYEEIICEDDFTISKLTTTAEVVIDDCYVGDEYSPVVTTDSTGGKTFEYKVKGAEDSTYNDEPPTAAGSYTVRATVAETATYMKIVCFDDFIISKITPTAKVSVPNVYVGTVYDAAVITNSDGDQTIEFKEDVEGATFSETKPVAAGNYIVRLTVAESDQFEGIVVTSTFKISEKLVADVIVTISNVKVGESYAPTATCESGGDITYDYKVKGTADATYTGTPPTAAGTYIVRATVEETADYAELTGTAEFTISRLTTTAEVVIDDCKVGDEYAPVVTTISTGGKTYEYKVKGAEDSTYVGDQPTAAGTYTVRATVAETDTYEKIVCFDDFTISKITVTAKVKIDDCYVGDEYAPVVTTVSDGGKTYEYKVQGTEDSTYDDEKPTAAGDYTVRVTVAETDTYEEIICEDDFTISKITPTAEVSVPNIRVGMDYSVTVDTDSDGDKTIEFMEDVDGAVFSETKPTAAGNYIVRATIAESDKYEGIVVTSTFKISEKLVAEVIVTISDVMIGESYAPSATCESTGGITFDYKVKGTADTTYSDTKPTTAGTYIVRATVEETADYAELTGTAEFTISRLTTTAEVVIDDCYVGDEYAPIVTTVSTGGKTYEFKVKGAEDTTYTDEKPVKAGDYTVRATVEETDTYKKIVCFDDFTISKRTVTATVEITNCYVGDEYAPVVTTVSDGGKTYKYKVKGTEDSTYSDEKPTAAGEYTVRAMIAETDTYEEIICEDDFTISKLIVSATVEIENCYVGDEYAPVVTTVSDGGKTYEYKVKGADDSTYVGDKPTAAGEYTVRATIAETDTYEEIICEDDFTISKLTAGAEVVINDCYVGDEYTPVVTTVSDGGKTFEYKVKGAEDSTYKGEKPAAAGDYTVRATIAETDTYEKIVCFDDFTIRKLTPTAEISVPNIRIGMDYGVTVDTDSDGAKTIEYKEDVAGAAFSETKPTAAGNYIVRVTIAETDTFEECVVTSTFKISEKLVSEVTVTISDVKVGESYTPSATCESTGQITFEYKVKGTADTTYSETQPTAAGTYIVRATVAETADYAELIGTAEFTISKLIATATVVIDDCYVGDEYAPVVTTVSDGGKTYEYKAKDAEDTTYTGVKPTAAGQYTVRATVAETDTYEKIVCEDDFTISRITPMAKVTVPDSKVGTAYTVKVDTESDGAVTIEYKGDAEGATFSETRPTAAGDYVVRVTIAETDTYEKAVCEDTFTISKNSVSAKINVSDIVIGTAYAPSVRTTSDGAVTYAYKAKDADDTMYSGSKPTAAGTYTVRATIAETDKYLEIVVTEDFTIRKISNVTATVTVPDITEGTAFTPKVTTKSDGAVTFVYKKSIDGDSAYTDKKPEKPGTYTVRATVAETETYEKIICTGTFTIFEKVEPEPDPEPEPETEKLVPVSKITITGRIYYGTKYEPSFTTNSDSKEEVVYLYRNRDTNSGYFREKPQSPGRYSVRVSLPETEKYQAAAVMADFEIVYLPAPSPAYSFVGEIGKNDYFIEDIRVAAPKGYHISTRIGGEYVDEVPYEGLTNGICLRRDSDGAMTAAILVNEVLKKDAELPKMTGEIRDEDGKTQSVNETIYANEISFAIGDDHLTVVRVNGIPITPEDNQAEIQLETNGGELEYYIEAEDEAGNILSFVIRLFARWMKDDTMPDGFKVILKGGHRYKLNIGSWRRTGDSTVYNGGGEFYVDEDTECTFNKIN